MSFVVISDWNWRKVAYVTVVLEENERDELMIEPLFNDVVAFL